VLRGGTPIVQELGGDSPRQSGWGWNFPMKLGLPV